MLLLQLDCEYCTGLQISILPIVEVQMPIHACNFCVKCLHCMSLHVFPTLLVADLTTKYKVMKLVKVKKIVYLLHEEVLLM